MRFIGGGIFALALLLTGCGGGSSGSTGPAGPAGPPGPPAVVVGLDVGDARSINATITAAQINGPLELSFSLESDEGRPVLGLPASAVSFKLARLVPGTDGAASAWQSYFNRVEQAGVGPGTEATVQATTENGSRGTFVDHGDGTYSYTSDADISLISEPLAVDFEPALTHRASFEIRGYATVANPLFDFRPDDEATTNLFRRDIVAMGACNDCHGQLAFHGGARNVVEECVLCHNPGSTDANSANSLDMTVMIHKIHRGAELPSVLAGGDYCLYGRNDALHCYGDVVNPYAGQPCAACHGEANALQPQADNWFTQPTAAACASCHDDVDFVSGVNHGPGIPAGDAECASCHVGEPDRGLDVRQVHRNLAFEQRALYRFNILAVDMAGPRESPQVTFSVTNPESADQPYDMQNDPVLTASSLSLFIAWNTQEYTNAGNGIENAQPSRLRLYSGGVLQASNNGDLTYTATLPAVAATASGSATVTFEGRIAGPDGNVAVATAHRYVALTDDPLQPVPRRTVVDIARCNDCHALVSFHGANRNDSIESCQICHNPEAARAGNPSPGAMDMKVFLHRIHAVDAIRYPRSVANCTACHTDESFYPTGAASNVLASSTDRGTDLLDSSDNSRTSANSASCGVCHSSADARAHMQAQGGSFDACQEGDGSLRARVDVCGPSGNKSGATVAESCAVCHGAGRISDTAIAHGVN